MATRFKAVENKDWYRDNVKNKQNGRYEVRQYDGREYVATTGFSSANLEEAVAAAAAMQADEDAGITIDGVPADDRHAMNAGMATQLVKYYDDLPALVAELGVAAAEARHPWRARLGR